MRRVIVHADVADALVERLVAAYRRLPIGSPQADATLVGPLGVRRPGCWRLRAPGRSIYSQRVSDPAETPTPAAGTPGAALPAVPEPARPTGLRAADRDREAVAEQLRDAAGDGRLDFDELDQRLGAAYAAKTHAELEPLVVDLAAPKPARLAAPAPPPVLRLQARSGHTVQDGHWVVPERVEAECTSGRVKVDFTQAVCDRAEVVLDATSTSGTVTAIVPRGWAVRIEQADVTSGNIVNKATDQPDPDAPLLRLYGHVKSGTVSVRYPGTKRQWFWLRWFRRTPPQLTR